MLGDFGARDPFPAEIASGFAEKVLGNVDTEHRILIPNLSALSLAQQNCTPISPLQPPISREDAQKLLRKVNLHMKFQILHFFLFFIPIIDCAAGLFSEFVMQNSFWKYV